MLRLQADPYMPPAYGFAIPRYTNPIDRRAIYNPPGCKTQSACRIKGPCFGIGPARRISQRGVKMMDFDDECTLGSCCDEARCLQRARDFYRFCGNVLLPLALLENSNQVLYHWPSTSSHKLSQAFTLLIPIIYLTSSERSACG